MFIPASLLRGYSRIQKSSGGMNGTQQLMIINGGYHPHSTCFSFHIEFTTDVERIDVLSNLEVSFKLNWVMNDCVF